MSLQRPLAGFAGRPTAVARWMLVFLASCLRAAEPVSTIRADETILFYPASGCMVDQDAGVCETTLSGVVYELEPRGLTLGVLKQTLGLAGAKMTEAQEQTLRERGRLFLVDHESRKRVVVRLADQTFQFGPTSGDGRFSGRIRWRIPQGQTPPESVEFRALLTQTDPRVFAGRVSIAKPGGWIVVSDIDDTIRETGVGNRKEMLGNTFLEPYRPVAGMAELYHRFQGRGAAFHYVSASPWQLYLPLSGFLGTNGFPGGVFHLKEFRLNNRSALSLFQDPEQYKTPVIERLLRDAPGSRFILVGDAGEKDPEIYTTLARKYPRQVWKVLIRLPASASLDEARRSRLANGLEPDCLIFFSDPAAVPWFGPKPK